MLWLADRSKKRHSTLPWWCQEKTTQLVEAMAVVSSCGRTTRARSSPLSAHLQAGKGRSLTLEHAHRTAAAMAQICLKQGNQGTRSPEEAKEFQDRKTATTLYRASPPVN